MKKESFIYKVISKSYAQRIEKKNKLMGIKKQYNLNVLLTYHFFITLSLFIFLILVLKEHFIYAPIITVLYFYFVEYLLFDLRLEKRRQKINKEAVFFFQVLTLSLESGADLKKAIESTSSNIKSNLSDEFNKALEDMQLGKTLTESLTELKERIPSDVVGSIIFNLTQSNIYGGNMIESLNNQLLYLNDKILFEVKGKINKMPIKISVISVLIFIPLILLIILSPIFIEFIVSR